MSPAIITRPSWYYYARAEDARAVYIKSSNLRATEKKERKMSRTRATRNRRSRERFSSSSSRALNSELFLPRENPKRKRLRPSTRQRERERERERTMSALCVICVKRSVKLRHETLQFFPSFETSKKQNDRTQQKTIVTRASNEKRNETREKRRTNERTNGNGAKTLASALSPRAYNFWGGGPPLRAVEF